MTSITYDASEAYRGNRPYADVILHGPTGRFPVLHALVDTGADFAQLDWHAAALVGIDVQRQGTPHGVATAGGPATLMLVSVDLEVFSTTLNVPVLFGSGSNPLLGRQAIFQWVQEAGFGTQRWLQQW